MVKRNVLFFLLFCCPLYREGIVYGQVAWEAIATVPRNLNCIIYQDSQFVAVGDSGTIVTSFDCNTWTQQKSMTTKKLSSIAYGGGSFVIIGEAGTILTSTDCKAWTAKNFDTSSFLLSICYGKGRFIALEEHVTNGQGHFSVCKSADGSDWSIMELNVDVPPLLNSIAYGDGKYVITGGLYTFPSSSAIMTSADGTTWASRDAGTNCCLRSVSYCNNRFIAMGSSWVGDGASGFFSAFSISPDGETWHSADLGWSIAPASVAFGNGLYVGTFTCMSILDNAWAEIKTSPDCITWTDAFADSNTILSGIVYGKSKFVAIGNNGTIFVSKGENTKILQKRNNSDGNREFTVRYSDNTILIQAPYRYCQGQWRTKIFNLNGKVVYSAETPVNKGALTIPNLRLPMGKYLISITTGGARVFARTYLLTK